MSDVEERPHGVALKFNHGMELFFSNPNEDRVTICATRYEEGGRTTGHIFELTEAHRLALWRLFTPDRAHT